jgi:hypothetical protein
MSTAKKISGIAIATAAAGFFALAPISGAIAGEDVKCMGANSCKGLSACKTANSECKGLNNCKGQGWSPTASAEECTAAGGTVES